VAACSVRTNASFISSRPNGIGVGADSEGSMGGWRIDRSDVHRTSTSRINEIGPARTLRAVARSAVWI